MPFVSDERRIPLLEGRLLPEVPGDLCFLAYKGIMRRWDKEPKWTTIDALYRDFVQHPQDNPVLREIHIHSSKFTWDDIVRASKLAYDVFFAFYAMPYEVKKREENGDIHG